MNGIWERVEDLNKLSGYINGRLLWFYHFDRSSEERLDINKWKKIEHSSIEFKVVSLNKGLKTSPDYLIKESRN